MNEPPIDSGRPPPLREELHLFPGPRTTDGAPTWTLGDPATNQFFRLGWREFEILCRWRRGGPARIAELVSSETTLEATTEDVQELIRFLLGANLLRPQGERGLERLSKHVQSMQQSWMQHLFHAYLFFRVPLFNPDRLLRKTLPWVLWAFSRRFFIASGIAGVIGLHSITRQWDIALATFSETDFLTEVLFVTFAMFLTKAIHELGHAYTAVRYGCRVPTIGVAFLMLLPVLYTDTSDVWKLASRERRLVIAGGGMLAELMLTAWASLLWGLLPIGGTKDALFFIATVSWISTLLMNASPFLRFDGYYLLSDWLGVENLHERAGRLGRWKLRELLLGLGAPFPDAALHDRQNLLIAFAWVTWIYRFFLYLGIAIAVYHLFFKILGILLMSVEIGWFLVRPIWSEIRAWLRPETHVRLNKRTLLSFSVLIGLIVVLFIPWKGSLQAPAVLQREQQVTLYAPMAGQILSRMVEPDTLVAKGQPLLQMVSPELENQMEITRSKIDLSSWKIHFRGSVPALIKQSGINDKELELGLTHLEGLQHQREKLTVTAPFDGRVTFVGREIKNDVWVASGEPLLQLTHPDRWQLIAYIREGELSQVEPGDSGRFLPEGIDWDPIECQVISIAPVGATRIDEPVLFTQFGGTVPVRRNAQGQWIPTTAIYRVILQPKMNVTALPHLLRGIVVIKHHTARSLLSMIQRTALESLIRETGF
ncbi:MAG: HlyD family efflux transporter periplasmic adaptor subunit [Magnetococcales bacterium]|nr:HlyD family efflux transporter periplasmic adaptor subunit [Magnetococcales bacterium]